MYSVQEQAFLKHKLTLYSMYDTHKHTHIQYTGTQKLRNFIKINVLELNLLCTWTYKAFYVHRNMYIATSGSCSLNTMD